MLLFIHTKQNTTPHIYRDRCQSVFLPPQSPPPKFSRLRLQSREYQVRLVPMTGNSLPNIR